MLLDSMVPRRKAPLQEGTVIVFNGEEGQGGGGETGTPPQDLKALVAQVLQQMAQDKAEKPKKSEEAEPPEEDGRPHIQDNFVMNQGKSQYRFQVKRNEQGLISDMLVQEL